jgi:hypothetical protein
MDYNVFHITYHAFPTEFLKRSELEVLGAKLLQTKRKKNHLSLGSY